VLVSVQTDNRSDLYLVSLLASEEEKAQLQHVICELFRINTSILLSYVKHGCFNLITYVCFDMHLSVSDAP